MSDDANNNQPDMDLISMVQRGRIAHDTEAKPSQVNAVYWIEAKRKTDGPSPTPRAGRWVIVTTVQDVDVLWERIKGATEQGLLGYKSKVTTSSRGEHPDMRMIYVLTYDREDQADVERVHQAIQGLGVNWPISFEGNVE